MTIDELIEEVKQELAQAIGIYELKKVRRKASVIRRYAKYARLTIETINAAAEVQLRAERKLGQRLQVLLGDSRNDEQET